jgi:hypothetical protein
MTFEAASELSPSFPGLQQAIADLLERSSSESGSPKPDESEAETFESFDDLVAEITAEAAVLDATQEPNAAVVVEDEEPDPDTSPEADAPRKRKKKISFV